MMTTSPTLPAASSFSPAVLLTAVAWLISYFVARYVLDTWPLEQPWDIVAMSVPLLVFFWFVWAVQRTLRSADELHRRIHLEAFALAFLVTMLVAMGLGLIEDTPRGRVVLPWRNLWLAMPVIYGLCFWIARRHYR